MKQVDDIARLVALRALREEHARMAIAVETARLKQKQHALCHANAAIATHDTELDEREQKFLNAMNISPVSERELGRVRDRLFLSDQQREVLQEARAQAEKSVCESEKALDELHSEWRQRLFARDKLADMHSQLNLADRISSEARSELEIEELSVARTEAPC
ncbi:hypothetical protein AAIB41_15915 [Brucella sp. BE17]|uniref:hypothetical protein n=1 Tax=Brucella sp. BE17 TaxID=3142977 RepID=UPI0031B9E4D6